jgi:hypothetical protein
VVNFKRDADNGTIKKYEKREMRKLALSRTKRNMVYCIWMVTLQNKTGRKQRCTHSMYNKTMEAWMRDCKSKTTNETTTMTFLENKARCRIAVFVHDLEETQRLFQRLATTNPGLTMCLIRSHHVIMFPIGCWHWRRAMPGAVAWAV